MTTVQEWINAGYVAVTGGPWRRCVSGQEDQKGVAEDREDLRGNPLGVWSFEDHCGGTGGKFRTSSRQ